MIKKAIEIKGIRKIVKSFYRKYDNCLKCGYILKMKE
jgi:hypothetical protein